MHQDQLAAVEHGKAGRTTTAERAEDAGAKALLLRQEAKGNLDAIGMQKENASPETLLLLKQKEAAVLAKLLKDITAVVAEFDKDEATAAKAKSGKDAKSIVSRQPQMADLLKDKVLFPGGQVGKPAAQVLTPEQAATQKLISDAVKAALAAERQKQTTGKPSHQLDEDAKKALEAVPPVDVAPLASALQTNNDNIQAAFGDLVTITGTNTASIIELRQRIANLRTA